MASHHHHHSHLLPTCNCSCDCNSPPQLTDPLIQAVASHILQSAHSQYCAHYPPVHTHKFQPQNPPKQKRFLLQQLHQVTQHPNFSSLLSRIEALESLLHQSSDRHSYSLRDAAARTIQTHFRAFLVRRSRTLGQLKDLAAIKSSLNFLKSSLETHHDLTALSRGTMSLLLDLDSIQGNDPMIRDSKRSISRDLVRFLEQIDNVIARRNGLPLQGMKNLRLSQNTKSRVSYSNHEGFENQKETIEKIRNRVEKLCRLSRIYDSGGDDLNLKRVHHFTDEDGEESPRILIRDRNQTQNRHLVTRHKPQLTAKKSVRFAENKNLSKILGENSEHFPNEDGSLEESDSSDELVENTCDEAEEIKEFSEVVGEDEDEVQRDGGSPETSDGDRNPRIKMTHEATYEAQAKNGGRSEISAPLPVKMENKADLMKNRKPLKIFG